jgi:hypothetical protein
VKFVVFHHEKCFILPLPSRATAWQWGRMLFAAFWDRFEESRSAQ